MKTETRNWLESAEYDLETACSMLSARRYLYVVFFCHLTLEKALKAIVTEITGHTPPRTHDLVRLIKLAEVTLEPLDLDFVSRINIEALPSRYPVELQKALVKYSENSAELYIQQTEKVLTWLKQKLT